MRVALVFLLLLAFTARGADWFVDFAAGSDSNDGTTTGTAWKRVKGMANVAGTAAAATISAGDRVIFKGGSTWTASWPFTPSSAGLVASKIFYTTNGAWGSGRAVFDAEYADFGSGPTAGMVLQTRSNVVYCGLSMVNMRLNTNVNQGVLVATDIDFEITNCVFGPWRYGASDITVPAGCDSASCGGYAFNFAALVGSRGTHVFGSTFHQTGINNKFGVAVCGGILGVSNVIKDVAAGVRAGDHHGTQFLNVGTPSDVLTHTDVFTTQNRGNLYGCLLSNITTGAAIQFQNLSGTGNAFTNQVVNCVVLSCTPAPIEIHAINAGFSFEFLNNTLEGSSGIYVSDHGGNPILRMTAQNNNLISSGPGITIDAGMVTTIVSSHNLTNSVATASGYGATLANHYRPTTFPSAPIDGGTNLVSTVTNDINNVTRPQGEAFDIGAFEFVPASAQVPSAVIAGRVDLKGRLTTGQ